MLIIVDKLQKFGGAENVLVEISRTFPKSTIYTTSIQNIKYWREMLPNCQLILPWWGRFFSNRIVWFIFYPLICLLAYITKIETKDDVLVYSSSAGKFFNFSREAKSVILYSNYPARGIFFPDEFFSSRIVLSILLPIIYAWRAIERRQYKKFTKIVCISRATKQAFISSLSIYPEILNCPIRKEWFSSTSDDSDNTLVKQQISKKLMLVSRLEKWKALDFILSYFNSSDNGVKLDVFGDGGELNSYRDKYPNIKFFGYVTDTDLKQSTRNYFGLVFPTEQEWSLVPIEANSTGLPILAVECLSASETQILLKLDTEATDGYTCVTYKNNDRDSLNDSLTKFLESDWDRYGIIANSKRFHPDQFAINLKSLFK